MSPLKPDGSKRLSLSGAQFRDISTILAKFHRKTKCGVAMLSDESGLAIAQSGSLDEKQMSILSTLAAGNHAATKEMARLIGEDKGFRVLFHEGEKNSVFICEVTSSSLFVVVFSDSTTFGMVRVLAATVCEELRAQLEDSLENSTTQNDDKVLKDNMGSNDFQQELDSRLNSVLFGVKN